MPYNPALGLLKKCNILFEDEVISDGLIMSTFTGYIARLMDGAEKSSSLIYHTESQIFDILLTLYIALSCIIYDELAPEDIVESLKPGDIVIFENKRAKFLSIDGIKEIHDAHRKLKNGDGSFDTVIERINYIHKYYPDYFSKIHLNLVVSPRNEMSRTF